MANGWTDERRAKQAAAIHRWAPWTKSTGPRTAAGKAIVGQNALRFTCRKALKFSSLLLKQQRLCLAGLPSLGRVEIERLMERALCTEKDRLKSELMIGSKLSRPNHFA